MAGRYRIRIHAVVTLAAAGMSCGGGAQQSCVDRVPNFTPTALHLTADASGLLVSGTSLVSFCGDDPGPQPLYYDLDLTAFVLCKLTALPGDAQAAPALPSTCNCTLAFAESSGGKSLRVYVSKTPDQAKKEIAVVDVSGPTSKSVASVGVFDGVHGCP